MTKSKFYDTKIYYLIDSRGGVGAAELEARNLDEIFEDWDRFILLAATSKECCHAANTREYGDLCIVTDIQGNIKWEWFVSNVWKIDDKEKQHVGIRKRIYHIAKDLLDMEMTPDEVTTFLSEQITDIHGNLKAEDVSGC